MFLLKEYKPGEVQEKWLNLLRNVGEKSILTSGYKLLFSQLLRRNQKRIVDGASILSSSRIILFFMLIQP
jgi:ribosomal protein L7Ae-like RNA K-turn-binding protein